MALAVIHSRAILGVDAPQVTIEVHLSTGMPAFTLVGLAEISVKEARDRVRSAIINAGFEFPSKRLTVNLAPADLPKESGRFDLPIALGILAVTDQLSSRLLSTHEFIGELALSGQLRSVKGVLPAALAAKKAKRILMIPTVDASQAELITDCEHKSASNLLDVCHYLDGVKLLKLDTHKQKIKTTSTRDLTDIIGQEHGKRALEVSAAGSHNLLFLGPPGTGKTMLATRMIDLMPDMDDEEALQTAAVISLTDQEIGKHNWKKRPLRTPHHTCTRAALIGGGGNKPHPGEISLAHNGLLFLDEIPHFSRATLDALREPLESGEVIISRAKTKTKFPAKFQLLAALNPSPSGFYEGNNTRTSPQEIMRYLSKISGPLLDRFDLSVEIPLLPKGALAKGENRGESTEKVKERVIQAQQIMRNRQNKLNAHLTPKEIEEYCKLETQDANFLETALHRLGLSVRAYHRIIRVSRTLADLESNPNIQRHHITEALGYRAMDRLLQRLAEELG